ncbi:MAG TPA: carboxypeptidase-like regulatory domain-containing protein [Nitrospiraceae bacterium]|nr:carboxypeptidase-like regulatory domain-containing protein [Nitrospiraceae bacterium]
MGWKQTVWPGFQLQLILAAAGVMGHFSFPAMLYATHEADHRFTVEGFVCGADGKGSPNVEVLVKDTRISYGQTVTTDGDGYYKATFHLHNDNLGDPLFVEARGEQQNHKIQFDPKDLEAERKIEVNFGTGCIHDRNAPPGWLLAGVGVAAVGVGGLVGVKMLRAWRKQQARREKGQTKKKK